MASQGEAMTERELVEIEARLEAELALDGWADDDELDYDLLRDEMPRLLAEVRRLQAQVRIYRDGLAELETDLAARILERALAAGRERRDGAGALDADQEAILEALEREMRAEMGQLRSTPPG